MFRKLISSFALRNIIRHKAVQRHQYRRPGGGSGPAPSLIMLFVP